MICKIRDTYGKKVFWKLVCLFIGILFINGFYIEVVQAQWATSGSNIYNSNSGNVGIGTTSPTKKLSINGEIQMTGYPTGVYLGNGQGFFDNGNGGLNISVLGTSALSLITNGGNLSLNGGNVGIGKTNPNYTLDVNGTMRLENSSAILQLHYPGAGTGAGIPIYWSGDLGGTEKTLGAVAWRKRKRQSQSGDNRSG
ncbi:MAG: hypothetical protein HY036_11865 [Nitrospirae bacterium]|nr:hypothetical protein [Nitrospirota bacterium]MBI3353258.1 hypothetical protein [Nitrospirota bacterium]